MKPRTLLVIFGAALVAPVLVAVPAHAHPEHQREFLALYSKPPAAPKDFRGLARQAKCNVCHAGKKDRKNYNAYGAELRKLLTEADRKDKAKIAAAIGAVALLPSGPDGSPTFGELIAGGELPGGPLAESKKEPTATESPSKEN